ncbi:nucleotidyltransferase family protein [Psychrobacter sp.]|uniref:nucleotidyltransferase family protein n=1 Tax=Psychrobacter sp. TaxID=56811 RepID=UPI003BAEDC72
MNIDESTLVDANIQQKSHAQQQDHAIIILASGLSSRLGKAKQLLCKDGEPLISHMLKLALSTYPQESILVIPKEKPLIANAIEPLATQHPMIHTVINPTAETGMAQSLRLGIDALTDVNNRLLNRVLIIGIDQVLLDKQHLIALLAGKQAVVASSYSGDNDWQRSDKLPRDKLLRDKMALDKTPLAESSKKNIIGMPLVINYELLKQWQSELVGDKGLRHLIRGLSPNQIQVIINHQLNYDIDTPEQLAYAQQQGWLDKSY